MGTMIEGKGGRVFDQGNRKAGNLVYTNKTRRHYSTLMLRLIGLAGPEAQNWISLPPYGVL